MHVVEGAKGGGENDNEYERERWRVNEVKCA
jgi:hypothetical protein